MRRHPSLIPLSREHRKMLMLAQLLKKNAPPYKGLPQNLEGKIKYAQILFDELIYDHFEVEILQLFEFVLGKSEELDLFCEELELEHQEIIRLFHAMVEKPTAENANSLGFALEKHIRKEEREFFQLIQSTFGEDLASLILEDVD